MKKKLEEKLLCLANQSRNREEYRKKASDLLKNRYSDYRKLLSECWHKRTSELLKFAGKSWYERQLSLIRECKRVQKGEIQCIRVKILKNPERNINRDVYQVLMRGYVSINSALVRGREFNIEKISDDGLYIQGTFESYNGLMRRATLLTYDINIAASGLIIY